MTGDRESFGHHKKQDKRKAREQRRVRLLQGMMCFCLIVVCVGTVVLAAGAFGSRKGRGKAGGGMRRNGAVTVGALLEEDIRQTAEVRRPHVEVPEMGALFGIHVQGKGWSNYFADNAYGMAPAGGYITAVRATLHNQPQGMTGTIEYQVNLSGSGWLDWQTDAGEAGDSLGAMPLEAVSMRLTGELAQYYDVIYSVLQNGVWTDWVKNGEEAGKAGVGLRVDGVRVSVARKQEDGLSYAGEIDPLKPMVALTYDDGPSKNSTPRILDTLKANGGRATFFMVGNRAEKNGTIIRQMVEQGCEVANHTYDHTLMTKVDPTELERQLMMTNQVVSNAGGITPVLMRPCGGATNDAGMGVAGAISMPAILWSIDTLDWKTRDVQATISAVLDHVQDGDIILMHDLYETAADASEVIIPELIARGYQLVTVSELSSYRGGMTPGKSYYKFRP
ncbi:MAG: polysaccharide deacetylase family protein [Lachnospiraceae bacterium]|nr:polysaccharide deacetylase family protein [Lachnospiraceae bacterium]MCI9104483.1 polysaccharide deacetylase family protein [Lachnospiraceae bacterium]